MSKPKPLTPKQALFVGEYLKDLNATQAAVRAGYSPKTAEQQGPRLLGNVGVRKAIDEALERRAKRVEVKADDVLSALLRVLNADIGKAYDSVGNLLPVHKMPEEVRLAISSVEVDEIWEGYGEEREQVGITKKVKFWSKDKAIELGLRHLGLLKDKVEVEATLTLEELVLASMKKPGGE